MKIALLSANIGGIDEIRPPVKQTQEYELFYYTENTLPFPLPNLDSRMKGKYFKTQSHRFLDHDIFIWIDGSVEITDGTFIAWVQQKMEKADIVNSLHFDRDNVYEEIEFITDHIKQGHPYIVSRYASQPFKQEYDFYLNNGLPATYPLYNCWFFARRNNPRMNKLFDEWWDLILSYTNFDQTQFSYVAWKNNVVINSVKTADYLIRHKHK